MAKRTFKWLWYSLATLIILIAVLVSVGRLLLPQASQFRPDFERYLAKRTGAAVQIGAVSGVWRAFGPELDVRDLILRSPQSGEPLLKIARFTVALDIPRSVASWHAIMRRFEVDGLEALVELDSSGALVLPGLDIDTGGDSNISAKYVVDSLLRQNRVAITDTHLRYRRPQGDIISLTLSDLSLRNRRGQHQAFGELQVRDGGTAKFVLEFDHYPLGPDDRMSLYAESQALDLARLPILTEPLGVRLEDGDLQLQVWARWREGGWRDGQATVQLKDLLLSNREQERRELHAINGQLHFARAKDDVWYLHGDDVRWQVAKEKPTRLSLEGRVQREGDGQRWGLDIGSTQLADLISIARFSSAVPATLRQHLTALEASASLPRLQLDLQIIDEAIADWAVATQFENLNYRSDTLPLLPASNGRLLVAQQAGVLTGAVRVRAAEQLLDLHDLFRAPLALTALDAGLRWQQQPDGIVVTIPQALLHNADATVRARAAILLPTEGKAELALAAELEQGNGSNKSAYFPTRVMKPSLVEYLDAAIEQATVRHAGALLHGPLAAFPFAHQEGVFDIEAAVEQGQFRFQPDWPGVSDLQATLHFTGSRMDIGIERAELAGLRVKSGTVSIPELHSSDAVLEVRANATGTGQQAFGLLAASPLRDTLRPVTDTLALDGSLRTALELDIPLKHSRDTRVRGRVAFDDATLRIVPIALPVSAATGVVEFAEFGVTGGEVRGTALGGVVQAAVSGDADGGRITLQGAASQTEINHWQPHPLWQKMQGSLRYDGTLLLPGKGQQGVSLQLQSDLQGLAIAVPAPYGKPAEQLAAVSALLQIDQELTRARIDLPQALVLEVRKPAHAEPEMELLLGGASFAGGQPGFSIRGQLAELAAEPWIPFIADLAAAGQEADVAENNGQAPTGSEAAASSVATRSTTARTAAIPATETRAMPRVDVTVERFDFYGMQFENQRFVGSGIADTYQLKLEADALAGDVRISRATPIQVKLSRFLHERAPESDDAAPTTADTIEPPPLEPVPVRDPASWPELDIHCDQCRFFGRDLGELTAQVRNDGADKRFQYSSHYGTLFTGTAEGVWSAATADTAITAKLTSSDIGKLHQQWGFDLSIRGTPGKIDTELRWPGSPIDFSLQRSHGSLTLDLGKGHITRESANAEKVLRVVSLFSIQSITRRLSLDFSDLFKEGFFYDSLRGRFTLADGKAVTDNTYVDGVSAGITIRGETDFVRKSLNQQIEVTPKLSSSLPVLVGWAISPTSGAIVWLMNKLFIEPMVKVVTGLQYTVSGPWDNPVVIERGRTEKEVPLPEETEMPATPPAAVPVTGAEPTGATVTPPLR